MQSPTLHSLVSAIDLFSGSSGIACLENYFAPAGQSPLFRQKLQLPDFEGACYFAPFQKHAINPALDLWPEGYNQCLPQALTDFVNAKQGGMFTVLRLVGGGYMALLPLVTKKSMAFFRGGSEGLELWAEHYGTGDFSDGLPLIAWSVEANLYGACEAVWRLALESSHLEGGARMRNQKVFPEVFKFLGWCTWEEYRMNIDEGVLLEAFDHFQKANLPVRWVMVDDGHIHFRLSSPDLGDTAEGAGPISSTRLLVSMGVDPEKFPRGWQPLISEKGKGGIERLGVWLNHNGYWGGVAEDNELGELNRVLLSARPGVKMPEPTEEASLAFYDALAGSQRQNGFDFVKVDNQASNITFYRGVVPNAVEATVQNNRALEEICHSRQLSLINCMAHNSLCLFNTTHSAVTRCSEDYLNGDERRAKLHLHNSFANMLLFGQTVWGDHDMFHTTDRYSEIMALSKAVSGGPVYVSDPAPKIIPEKLAPLCWSDGLVLRPLAPAVPLPESIFIDPYLEPQAFRVIAPLENGCAAVVAFNLTHPTVPVSGQIDAEDYRSAGGMLQDGRPEWEIPGEGLIAFDRSANRAIEIGPGGHKFSLPVFEARMFVLCPVQHGWAVPGLSGKYLSPTGVQWLGADDNRLELRLKESGPLLIWNRDRKPVANRFPTTSLGGGLWRAEIPAGFRDLEIVFTLE